MQDLGWYFAKKLEKSGKAGAIPITHVRLVYDSDNGEELGCATSVWCGSKGGVLGVGRGAVDGEWWVVGGKQWVGSGGWWVGCSGWGAVGGVQWMGSGGWWVGCSGWGAVGGVQWMGSGGWWVGCSGWGAVGGVQWMGSGGWWIGYSGWGVVGIVWVTCACGGGLVYICRGGVGCKLLLIMW